MNDRSSGRRYGLAVLVVASCAPLALPVAAESDSSTPGVLDSAPSVQDVLGQAGQQLSGLGAQPAAPPAERSAPQSGPPASPKRTAPAPRARPVAPSPAAPSAAAGRVRDPSPAGAGGDSGAGTNARAASPGSAPSEPDDAAGPPAEAADSTDASEAAAPPPTELGDNPDDESPATLPFTGSRPLSLLALGLVAFAIGAGVRWAVRSRMATGGADSGL
jgi:hypothetical protein